MNEDLQYEIERYLSIWDGTITGYQAKNMLDNGAVEEACELLGIDIDEYDYE